jgi:hypothetical protein
MSTAAPVRFQTKAADGSKIPSADGPTGRKCAICGRQELYAKSMRECASPLCHKPVCHMCRLQFDHVCSESCRADLIASQRAPQRSLFDIPASGR